MGIENGSTPPGGENFFKHIDDNQDKIGDEEGLSEYRGNRRNKDTDNAKKVKEINSSNIDSDLTEMGEEKMDRREFIKKTGVIAGAIAAAGGLLKYFSGENDKVVEEEQAKLEQKKEEEEKTNEAMEVERKKIAEQSDETIKKAEQAVQEQNSEMGEAVRENNKAEILADEKDSETP